MAVFLKSSPFSRNRRHRFPRSYITAVYRCSQQITATFNISRRATPSDL